MGTSDKSNINEEIRKNAEYDTWFSELIDLLKLQCKRWAIAFFIVLFLWAATIGGFIWYLNLYDFESYSQDGSGYNNINTGEQGDVINGAEIPPEKEKESE